MIKEEQPTILFMSTYPPRECGIATFTQDLVNAVDKKLNNITKSRILALNNNGVNIYNYPKKILYEVSDSDIQDYLETARKINSSPNIKLVCIQHEFGIFGGEEGDHLLVFLEVLKKPAVITFHSVIPEPDKKLERVVGAIAQRVNEIIVMTPKAVEILRKEYKLKGRISIIPHGTPQVNLESQEKEKKNLGFEDKIVLSSFGMMDKGKGYEYVIRALPEVVKKFPNLLYIIVGETHPIVRKREGEKYRNFLEKKIKSLGLQKHVKFYNKYVTLDEIIRYLKATDIYISPSLNQNQITSGTLAYALSCGRAVISTPFLHAKDVITKDNGLLVKFRNPKSFEKAITMLLENPQLIGEMGHRIYHETRHTTWQNVALSYSSIFKRYINIEEGIKNLPRINTSHIIRMTDNFGIIQFAKQSTPDINSGYSLDDNSRGALVSGMLYERFKEFKYLKLLKTYLSYIKYVQDKEGKLHNFVNKNKKINYKDWSEDAHGRAIWSLGFLTSIESIPEDLKREAETIMIKALPITSNIESARSNAFIIKGLYFYNIKRNSKYITANIKKMADAILSSYEHNSNQRWQWFEPYMTYANSKIPEALLYAYLEIGNKKYFDTAIKTLNFLISKTFENDMFMPIGQKGWLEKEGRKAYFDQQPIEAAYTIQTLALAHEITDNEDYKNLAMKTFQWFLGKNSLNQVMYNEQTGGCYDGLGQSSININQGAESTLSYLIAHLSLSNLYNVN